MHVSYGHIALAAYPICLMWLVAAALPALLPTLRRSYRSRVGLWWLSLALGYAYGVSRVYGLDGYGLLPLLTIGFGLCSLLSWRKLLPLGLLAAACAVIVWPAQYLDLTAILSLGFIALVTVAIWRSVFALLLSTTKGIWWLMGWAFVLLVSAAILAYRSSSPLAAVVLLIGANALLTAKADGLWQHSPLASFGARAQQDLGYDQLRFIIIAVPVLLSVEYLVFGF